MIPVTANGTQYDCCAIKSKHEPHYVLEMRTVMDGFLWLCIGEEIKYDGYV